MPLETNQFALQTVKGQLDMQVPGNTLSCVVSASQATPLIAGQAVKLEDSAGGPPKVLSLAADTDKVFGFVARNLKDQDRVANEPVEITFTGAVMYMEASAAIARGAKVEVVRTGDKVLTSAGTNPVVGWAMDKAVAAGDLIRIVPMTPNL